MLLQNAAGALPDPCLWGSLGTGTAFFLASISVAAVSAIVQNPEGPGWVKQVWGRVSNLPESQTQKHVVLVLPCAKPNITLYLLYPVYRPYNSYKT